jgi:hypothetical protein
MRKVIPISAILLCIIATGCGHKPMAREATTITLDYRDATPSFDMASMLEDSVEIVVLETTSESLIGKISDVRLIGDEIFIVADVDDFHQRVVVFDRKGKYLRQIGRLGRGPGEYLRIEAAEITDDYVVLFDIDQVKLLFYALDGSLIKSKDAQGLWANDMVYSDDNLYLVNSGSLTDIGGNYYLYELTPEGEYVRSLLAFDKEMDEKRIGWSIDRYCSKSGDEFLVNFAPYDSLYVMKNGTLKEVFYVDFGERKVPQSVINIGYDALRTAITENYIRGADDVHLTDRYIIISFGDSKEDYFGIYDRETGKSEVTKMLIDSRFPALPYWMPRDVIRDNVLIVPLVDAWVIKYIVTDNPEYTNPAHPKSYFQKKMIELAASLKEGDNPVLFIQKFK